MEIHVTSLNYSALRVNPSQEGRRDNVQNRSDLDRSASETSRPRRDTDSQSPEQVEKLLDDAGLKQLTAFDAERAGSSLDRRTLKAVNAYNDTFNQPLIDQRSELIAGIDLYV
ncbi:MAG: hypothetical protein Kow0065_14640 [Methylomicrobium sp.]